MNTAVSLTVFLDSKNDYTSLLKCRTPEVKSIRANIEVPMYNFETQEVGKLIWLPGSINLADPLRKIALSTRL